MASPITWRNVEAPDLRGAASILNLAQSGFNSGFDQLNNVLKREQDTAEANWKTVRDNNTQAFLNSINQYRTPEEYQAALQSGALDLSKYGAQIDQAAARSALDGRLATLQDRAVKAGQFEDQQKAREAKPIVDQLSMMALSDDKDVRASAKAALAPYMEAGMLPNGAELAGKIRNTDHENEVWGRDKIEFDRKGEKHRSDMLTASAQRNVFGAQAEHLREDSSGAKATLKAELAASKAENAAAALKLKNGPLDFGDLGSTEGKNKFVEGLKQRGVANDEADDIYKAFATQFSGGLLAGYQDTPQGQKPIRVPVPVSYALSAVEAAGADSRFRPNWLIGSNRGGRSVEQLKKLMEDPTYVDQLQEAMQVRGIQYRPLQGKSSGNANVAESASSRSSIPKPSLPFSEDALDMSGAAVMNQVIQSRVEKAKGMMTAEEIETSKKTGKLPFRIKQMLESENGR